jgi:hypothetical protein
MYNFGMNDSASIVEIWQVLWYSVQWMPWGETL